MAEQSVVELYQRIQQLKNTNGVDENAMDKQSEVFRLWGVIQWIFIMEGDQSFGFWIVKDSQLVGKVRDELLQAMEELNQAAITPLRIPTDTKMLAEDLPQFPKYLELPGPVVRQNILSFLGSEDLLNVARAIPSEAKYFKPPLTYLQMEEVFPLLMNRDLLDKTDINNLIQINSFFQAFVVRRFENVEWKDTNYFNKLYVRSSSAPSLKELPWEQGNYPICHPVGIELSNKMDSTMALLKTFGKRILHIHFQEAYEEDELNPEDVFQRIASCLCLTPNLKALSIQSFYANATNQESFPELPNLKSLYIDGEPCFEIPLLRKYGEQLKWLHVNTDIGEGLPDQYPVFSEGSSLSSLHLVDQGHGFSYYQEFLPPENIFNSLAACPIKVLELNAFEEPLHQLLPTVGNHWGNSLEFMKLKTIKTVLDMPDDFLTTETSIWLQNISFSRLTRLIILDYPLTKQWAFLLLLFPALEKLHWGYNPTTSIKKTTIFGGIQGEPEPMIKLFQIRSQMRRNNIWKLFPKLDKLDLGFNRALTRSECVAIQNQRLESENENS